MQQQRQNLNRREKRALARILLAAFVLALLFLAVTPGRSLHSYFSVKKKIAIVEAENRLLLRETVQLNEEIKLLQHDDQYLEKIAREKYGMLKKNEEVYYTQPIESAEQSSEIETEETVQ
ncbi:MAG: cell division protein FtsB [Candidatus Electronema aureum]|uniref:Cell division protein FtsB n=1 Tax=Candidatus Electronema aureum TaxID=2005002 RepID=A0A521G514_9BACT|nr:MAG: cell division protein FtsB [Candidatus Electronema aureum]